MNTDRYRKCILGWVHTSCRNVSPEWTHIFQTKNKNNVSNGALKWMIFTWNSNFFCSLWCDETQDWNFGMKMWIENGRVFGEGFEWKTSMVVWSCNSVFYQIILEMHHRNFQNLTANFQRCISEMFTELINYHYICWKYPKMYL